MNVENKIEVETQSVIKTVEVESSKIWDWFTKHVDSLTNEARADFRALFKVSPVDTASVIGNSSVTSSAHEQAAVINTGAPITGGEPSNETIAS